jgi:hypothetical protein
MATLDSCVVFSNRLLHRFDSRPFLGGYHLFADVDSLATSSIRLAADGRPTHPIGSLSTPIVLILVGNTANAC